MSQGPVFYSDPIDAVFKVLGGWGKGVEYDGVK